MALTSVEDIEARWVSGAFAFDTDVVSSLIDDAEDLISGFLDVSTEQELLDRVPRKRVVRVVARMVTRALRNPEGYRSLSEGTGPFSTSRMFGGDNPGEVELTPADKDSLTGAGRTGVAFTVFPTR